jgi:hypothetical protein
VLAYQTGDDCQVLFPTQYVGFDPRALIPLYRASLIAAMNGLTTENACVLPAASNACRVEKMNAGDP